MYCPEDVTTWLTYYDGEFNEDQDADARCSDCDLYPAYDECCMIHNLLLLKY